MPNPLHVLITLLRYFRQALNFCFVLLRPLSYFIFFIDFVISALRFCPLYGLIKHWYKGTPWNILYQRLLNIWLHVSGCHRSTVQSGCSGVAVYILSNLQYKSCTLVGNKIVYYTDVNGASPVGAAPATFSALQNQNPIPKPWRVFFVFWTLSSLWISKLMGPEVESMLSASSGQCP